MKLFDLGYAFMVSITDTQNSIFQQQGGRMNFSPALRSVPALLACIFVLAMSGIASAASVSGTLYNNTGKSGQAYLMLFRDNGAGGYDNSGIGASVQSTSGTPATYTIRGVDANSGSYVVKAFLDTRGNRTPFGTSPVGNTDLSASFEIPNETVTGKNLTVYTPTSAALITPVKPVWVSAAPSNGGVLVFWDTPKNTNQIEIADFYEVQYSTDSTFTVGVTTKTVTSQDDGHLAVTGLANGSVYYFRVKAKLTGRADSGYTVSSAVTIGNPAGGYTVSGTVNLSATGQSGNLVAVLHNDDLGAVYWTALSLTSAESSKSFTIAGVPNGSYRLFTFLDRNANNVSDSSDLRLVNEPLIQVAGANLTVSSVTLPVTDALAKVLVEPYRQIDQWGDVSYFGYNLTFTISDQLKTVANAAITGTKLRNPELGTAKTLDLAARMDGGSDLYATVIFDIRPLAGDQYTFDGTYTDGTSFSYTAVVTEPPSSFPSLTAIDKIAINGGKPLFTWSIPQDAQITSVDIRVESPSGLLWEKQGVLPSAGSIQYNYDDSATLPLLVDGASYALYFAFTDINGNGGFIAADFTPTSLPVIKGFSAAAAPKGSSITLYGFNFEPGNTTVHFFCSSAGTAAGSVSSDGTQLAVTVPADACGGPISVSTDTAGPGPAYDRNFFVQNPVSFSGSVRTSSGVPVAGAVVALKYYPNVATVTGSDGTFTLPGLPGSDSFRLKITRTGYYDAYSSIINSNQNIVATDPFIMFTQTEIVLKGFDPGDPVILGKAVDTTGSPLAGVTVTALAALDGWPLTVKITGALGGLVTGNTTAADGLFYVTNATPYDLFVNVTAAKSGYDFMPRSFDIFNFAVSEGPVMGIPLHTLSGFTPSSARPGDTVTISGTFPLPYNHYSATFNGLSASVTGGSSTSLLVTVPLNTTTGKITVTCNDTLREVTSLTNFTPLYRLSFSFTGLGSGSVNSIGGFSCVTPNTCTMDFSYNTVLTLTATSSFGSVFEKWGGTCTGSGNCSITFSQDRSARATFNYLPYVMIDSVVYGTIMSAYAVASDNDEIKSQAIDFPESFDLTRPINIILKGGYDSVFSIAAGYTYLSGPVTIAGGSVTIDRIVIE